MQPTWAQEPGVEDASARPSNHSTNAMTSTPGSEQRCQPTTFLVDTFAILGTEPAQPSA